VFLFLITDSLSLIQKLRFALIQYFVINISIILLLYLGTHEAAGSQLLPHLDSRLHSCEYSNVKDIQPQQKVQERVGMLIQEDNKSEDILTETSTIQHRGSNGNKIDLQNICREPVTHGGTAVNVGDVSETCDTSSDHGNGDEYQDVKFIPNELCTIATGTWEGLPNQLCRLCASSDQHPKQSIVGWMGMLSEIIPDLVSCLFLLSFFVYPCITA
jgi:hypothetical protein